MGCFSYTCSVSGLAIDAGDTVRYLLLTQSPYQEGFVCYSHGFWAPRTVPLKASYNDYGSVEEVEEGPSKDVWMEALQLDMVEKGVGDNSCHDVAFSRESTFEQMLEAVWECRVYVKQDKGGRQMSAEELAKWEEAQPEYKPTLRNVRKVLPTLEGVTYLVDDEGAPDYVRVRVDGYGNIPDEPYLKAQDALKNFATVLVAGSGTYADAREIRVYMAPGKDAQGHDRRIFIPEATPVLPVRQAMIREDVWQALLTNKIRTWDNKLHTASSYKKNLRDYVEKQRARDAETKKLWEELRANPGNLELIKNFYGRDTDRDQDRENPVSWILSKDPIPFVTGIVTHYKLLETSGRVTDEFLDSLAEFAFVQAVLGNLRFVWQPGHSTGPQSGDWEAHKWWVGQLNKIVKNVIKEHERNY